MDSNDPKLTLITLRLDEKTLQKLDFLVKQRGSNRSDTIRTIIRAFSPQMMPKIGQIKPKEAPQNDDVQYIPVDST
jgi:hypothetical protein